MISEIKDLVDVAIADGGIVKQERTGILQKAFVRISNVYLTNDFNVLA